MVWELKLMVPNEDLSLGGFSIFSLSDGWPKNQCIDLICQFVFPTFGLCFQTWALHKCFFSSVMYSINQPTKRTTTLFVFPHPLPLLIAKRIASFWREEAKMNKEKEPACVCTFDCFAITCGMKAGSLDRPPHNLMGTLQNHFLFTSEQHVTFGDSSPTSCLKFSRCNA